MNSNLDGIYKQIYQEVKNKMRKTVESKLGHVIMACQLLIYGILIIFLLELELRKVLIK